ncbi:PSD1 and planctomycete cytochrome C domain-containing protein [Pedosphaera parvula]|uniref:PSD1 and planctomycete cytochrome C domain-containing protein n=1 Tax=Pedosphaera parvula TaxID=1032527 RepID=UPI0007C75CD4|nr:PSD1 and planctomycete cytochrome C domain-containing protein [Pedosphaera parvula]
MKNTQFSWLGSALLALSLSTLSHLQAAEQKLTAEQTEFFEKKIRPILTDNCYKCHSHDSEKVKGGLLLDTRDGLLKGGDTGPAIVAGDLEKSLLIKAVRYKDKDLQMPPSDQQLAANQIQDLETWVKMGAPDPRTTVETSQHSYKVDFDKAKQHWSFQPVRKPSIPDAQDSQNWAQTPIDKFVLATLSTKNLSPSQKADKVTLLRRATFDLIGLPPTPKEVDEFLADDSSDAFAKVVDRLLASPHYGERWGRYWLDLAHFSDTRGTQGNNRDERYPYAYTYRDYVIRAFNEDLPYDQFLIQQIAADKLDLGEDKHALAAMGFLTSGNRFNNQINDIIDDRIDIIGKSTMALTVTCARCHDHKFDPIPTKDYYALHGVFNSSTEPKEEPLIEKPRNSAAYQAFQTEYTARKAAAQEFRDEMGKKLKAEMIGKSGSYLLALNEYKRKTNDISRAAFLEKRGLNAQLGAAWENSLKNWEKRHNPIFAPWIAFAQLQPDEFASKAKDLSAMFYTNKEKGKPINPLISRMFSSAPTSLGQVAARYNSVFNDIEERWQEVMSGYEARKKNSTTPAPEPKGLSDTDQEQVRQLMYANGSPMLLDDQRLNAFINRENKLRNKRDELEKAVTELLVSHPGSPARASVLEDTEKPKDSVVFIKGNPGNRGPQVQRHFLTILSGDDCPPFRDGSGRLELAKDIASRNNPLTARVMVNRIWLHHFGEGLVRTPDDFGTRGDTPSHPELLDYLASYFVEEGWSIKKMHRLIMLSSVYQQSSDNSPRYDVIDPDNRWLWRQNRRRLDFESLRDTILAIGGDLDLTIGGKSVKLDAEPYSLRRTIYGFVDRKNVPNMFQAFDFASPDLTTGKRETTVVPQQALFMMNSPLVIEQARNVIRRVDVKSQPGAEARVKTLYELIYQREPTEIETRLAMEYLRSDATTEWQTNAAAAWAYGYGEYDASMHRTKLFIPMTTYAGRSWQPDSKNADARLKGMNLTPDGGMPGKLFAVIRRWTCPRDGFISIDGILNHPAKDGDGVQGRIVSSRLGEIGTFVAFKSQVPVRLPRLNVKRGDVIDFIVECRENPRNDAFKWAPIIKMEPTTTMAKDCVMEWNAAKNFSGDMQAKHLGTWDKFAQVLLETNELTFIN